jgi:hypothetical protein
MLAREEFVSTDMKKKNCDMQYGISYRAMQYAINMYICVYVKIYVYVYDIYRYRYMYTYIHTYIHTYVWYIHTHMYEFCGTDIARLNATQRFFFLLDILSNFPCYPFREDSFDAFCSRSSCFFTYVR